jgi:hypothetical protein
MAKRRQQPVAAAKSHAPASGATPVAPPAKNPTLLGVSVVLFVLWFIFLLVTALSGG